ncbi:MAG: DNA repair protein RecN [Actinobacteria bacterium]|nr:DNA repair protein RecN [Actinomycetota bacterium]MCG2807137.1 DNA repair protein RecN [Coriobacteriia bacterium]
MLEELHVRNLALIEDVWLEFGPGMTVLTGETGAGKTALVGALKLLVGERADSTWVRAGAAEAVVEGRMRLPLGEILAKRRVSSDGRSKCTLDGEMATVGALAEALGPLVDLHGQHEHQSLLQPSRHSEYLDRYCGADAVSRLSEYRSAREDWAQAGTTLDRITASLAEARTRSDYLRFVVEEIAGVGPTLEEEAELDRRLPGLKHSERLSAAAVEAYAALRDESGASDALTVCHSALRHVADLDPQMDAITERLGGVAVLVDEIATDLRAYAESLEHDPREFDALQERLASFMALKKKYGPEMADVLRTSQDAEETLAALDAGQDGLDSARAAVDSARAALESAGRALASMRAAAAPGFVVDLASATLDLEMSGTSFEVLLEDVPFDEWGPDGPQRVEFMFAPGPDQPARPLARIASGGEISRVMLALKGVLGAADDVPVLVFDEVDAGIGGLTATAVGRRLKDLASRHQVLVVTHLAQVAAFADKHIVVEKHMDRDTVSTSVRAVEGQARVAEIARMLSGVESDAGLAHAEELLGSARSVQ